MKKTNRPPVVREVDGKADAVVQSGATYQRLLDVAARADVYEAIRQGLNDVAVGRTRPARWVLDSIPRKGNL